MYARAVNVQFQSGKIDEATRMVKDTIVPVLQEQKGFKGQFLLTQRDTGKAISINLWETEADLTEFEFDLSIHALWAWSEVKGFAI
jgi:heme-degrading monooxygenase HmoA